MVDQFLFFTPLLLLSLIALLGFAGCYIEPSEPQLLRHVQTSVKSASSGTNSIVSDPLMLEGGELMIAVVQWRPTIVTDTPSLSGGFTKLAGPFPWNNMQVEIFSARNPEGIAQLSVTATLQGSSMPWSLCVSAYTGVDETTPYYGPQNSALGYTGNAPQTPMLNVAPRDMVYAVAFAADGDGTFPGNNSFSAGEGFTAEFTGVTNPLVEDRYGDSNPLVAQAVNTNPNSGAPLGFIFAMGLKARA